MPDATRFVHVAPPSETIARRSHDWPAGMKSTDTDSTAEPAETAAAESSVTAGAPESDARTVTVVAADVPDAPRSFSATARA